MHSSTQEERGTETLHPFRVLASLSALPHRQLTTTPIPCFLDRFVITLLSPYYSYLVVSAHSSVTVHCRERQASSPSLSISPPPPPHTHVLVLIFVFCPPFPCRLPPSSSGSVQTLPLPTGSHGTSWFLCLTLLSPSPPLPLPSFGSSFVALLPTNHLTAIANGRR
jgi:hypothetical protein